MYLCIFSLGLDGNTSAQERERLINRFNAQDNVEVLLFMLSTRCALLLWLQHLGLRVWSFWRWIIVPDYEFGVLAMDYCPITVKYIIIANLLKYTLTFF